jgi:hypothetical protein
LILFIDDIRYDWPIFYSVLLLINRLMRYCYSISAWDIDYSSENDRYCWPWCLRYCVVLSFIRVEMLCEIVEKCPIRYSYSDLIRRWSVLTVTCIVQYRIPVEGRAIRCGQWEVSVTCPCCLFIIFIYCLIFFPITWYSYRRLLSDGAVVIGNDIPRWYYEGVKKCRR